ncbi:aspartyl/asparaginyl beta-hydroxylase domain-containing protein [Rhizorhabdus dicambivorans]|uniref:Aspartyl beta-hydroxylase n=1 Tax=Rhizorhabdus dicambivorans TaxID=1850238 RepID=A0A2A4G0Y5_9SPHN|nr:aspartyl/asparaginyl beta-hydroxylase domain-containing protein [Rhizorhabdus dicambivorans]ATE63434.1 aspartyl beta-hydroxylase [Rhizorhabdus dicambivorans]PCE43653.1 aspartyl beta-hydroxylase [Rhizorhabdus dicambivorans]
MRLDRPLLKLPCRYDAAALAAEVAALPPSAWLPHPGKLPGNDAVPLITPGGTISNGFAGPMAPTEHLRACPYIMQIMADIGAVWGRSRLMGLAPGSDVPDHVDVGYYWRTHLRVHVPIVTEPSVSFTAGGETVHMAAGECWVFDTFQMHRVRNGGSAKRVHLVLDTVGGERLWDLVAAAQAGAGSDGAELVPPGAANGPIAYEQVNLPEIMSGWEIRCHIDYLLGLAPAGPALDAVAPRLDRFASSWMAVWAEHGPSPAGLPAYRRLIETVREDLRSLRASAILLHNQVPLDRALAELIFLVAVPADRAPAAPAPALAAAR